MFKRFLISAMFALAAVSSTAFASHIDIKINGEYIYTDSAVIIENGVSLAPVRFICEGLGAEKINWNGKDQIVDIDMGTNEVSFNLNEDTAQIGNKKYSFSSDIRVINDRTYIPVRFISEFTGANVNWNDQYSNIEITLSGHTPHNTLIDKTYTDDEVLWLGRIVHAESQGEPMEGKIGVANVILNRVNSTLFPNTIYGVIFDTTYAVQFEPISNGSIYNNPAKDSITAAKKALRGENVVGKSLYFYNPSKVGISWISKTRPFYRTIANHNFYL